MKVRSLFILGICLALPAEAAYFRFLGGQTFPDEKGNQITMPTGTELEIADPKTDPLTADYQDPLSKKKFRLSIPREQARAYFETDSGKFRAYFQSVVTTLNQINGDNPANCVETPKRECILPGTEEDDRRSTLSTVLMTCNPGEPEIVKRSESGSFEDYRQSCAEGIRPGAQPGTWPAPQPDPVCTEEQAKILRSNEDKKHEAYLASCPAHEPNLGKLGLKPEPNCMLPAQKGQLKKIVLHASEGSPYSTPRALLCDYAKGNGYRDLPYHYYIAKDPATKRWHIFEGRSLKYQGAHVRAGLNADSIAIAIAGDYFPGGPSPAHPFAKSEAPPAEAVQLAQSLVDKLRKQYPGVKNIQGHGEALFEGDHCLKDCPGPGAQFVVNRLRDKFFTPEKK